MCAAPKGIAGTAEEDKVIRRTLINTTTTASADKEPFSLMPRMPLSNQNQPIQHYIFTVKDVIGLSGKRHDAVSVASYFIGIKSWPIFPHSRNRRAFKSGDKFILYVGGSGSHRQSFIGSGSLGGIRQASRLEQRDWEEFVQSTPDSVLGIVDFSTFPSNVSVRELMPEMAHFKGVGLKWGTVLSGGSRRITTADYELVLRTGSKQP